MIGDTLNQTITCQGPMMIGDTFEHRKNARPQTNTDWPWSHDNESDNIFHKPNIQY